MKKVKKATVKTMKTRLRQGDEVVVISGKDKGKRGTIEAVKRLATNVKVKVKGVGIVKKHVKPNPQANQQGGIMSIESFIDASNVMLFDSASQKGVRIGMKLKADGGKARCMRVAGELKEVEA